MSGDAITFDEVPGLRAIPYTQAWSWAPVWLHAVALAAYLPMITLGYGSDNDTYGILDAGRRWLESGHYSASRNPGFPIYEAAALVLARFGGSVLCNLGSIAMGLLTLNAFWTLGRRHHVPHLEVLATCLVLHPIFWIASTSTHDYVWGTGFFTLGVAALSIGWPGVAFAALAASIGTRLASVFGVAAIFAAFSTRAGHRREQLALLAASAAGGTFYLLPFAAAGWSLSFLQPGIGPPEMWTAKMWIGRFIYKNLSFWGLPAAAVAVVAARRFVRQRRHLLREGDTFVLSCLAVVLVLEGLFAKFPIEPGYLLPVLPFALLLLGVIAGEDRRLVIFALLAILTADVVQLDLARPNIPEHATDARFDPRLAPSVLMSDVALRLELRGCEDVDCWTSWNQRRKDPS